jgi:hypothetical protein
MNLTEAQQKTVSEWVAAGAKLSEVQNRLAAELGVRLTYMEVRLLVDDLKLRLVDPEPPKPITPPPSANSATNPAAAVPPAVESDVATGAVAVAVDQIAQPGTLVSGTVTFSDGMPAKWYLDQTGRLGLVPQQQGYKPAPGDIEQFRTALEREMAKLGF